MGTTDVVTVDRQDTAKRRRDVTGKVDGLCRKETMRSERVGYLISPRRRRVGKSKGCVTLDCGKEICCIIHRFTQLAGGTYLLSLILHHYSLG